MNMSTQGKIKKRPKRRPTYSDLSIDDVIKCVTTGEGWQFLRLADNVLEIDRNRYFIVKLNEILGILHTIVTEIFKDG
ncbi:MAG TPA: hypothetical protein VJL89_06440 [Thermodesulfovibrionia bacterium]|nr:hypothetical protein [Thermodesulfovibrionia bacterium]